MASRIYTRTGDRGETALADGRRVRKDAPRVEAYGDLDEANAWVGTARAAVRDPFLDRCLEFLQHRLSSCASNLAMPPGSPFAPPVVSQEDVSFLERAIDRFEERTGALSSFILPGGVAAAGQLHVARAVCRRAERRLVAVVAEEPVDEQVLAFVNRSSDFLFAAARYANAVAGATDVPWDKSLRPPALDL